MAEIVSRHVFFSRWSIRQVRSARGAIAILCGLLLGIVVYLAQSTYYRRKDQDKYALVRRFERLFTRKNQQLD